jgi:hypothetical protein
MWGEVTGLVLLTAVLFWFLRGRTAPVRQGAQEEDLSYEDKEARDELRRAEEEVREKQSSTLPDEEQPGDDWGPGTPRSY